MPFPDWPKLRHFAKTAAQTTAVAAAVPLIFFVPAALTAQTPSTPVQQTEQSASLHGIVLNANTNQPIARALVQVEAQTILTSFDGKFEFTNLGGTIASIKVTKPGFYLGLSPYQGSTAFRPVGSPDEQQIRLYPEALLTGTVTAATGDPLQYVNVQALRRVEDESGNRWIMGGQTGTDADGQFRLPLPGGEYVLETLYTRERTGTRQALLPTLFPSAGSSSASSDSLSTIHLLSGEEQHIDLHPPARPSHSVHIRIDSVDGTGSSSSSQNSPRIEAHLANGLVFSPGTQPGDQPGEKPGELEVNLPAGSYLLSASFVDRLSGSPSYGETKVLVVDEDVSGVVIHLQQATELSVEVSLDPAAASAKSVLGTDSLLRQLGLFLQKTHADVSLESENVSPTPHPAGQLGFSLLPGTYRLRTTSFNPWFIESATAGETDLLTQDLVIDGGSSSLPLRLVVNNQTATVKGTVKLAGTASPGYVYLIAEFPGTTPIISARCGQEGTFSRPMLPPGSYRVLASEAPAWFDLTHASTQTRLSSYLKTITVAAGETGSVDLDAVPASDWKQ